MHNIAKQAMVNNTYRTFCTISSQCLCFIAFSNSSLASFCM